MEAITSTSTTTKAATTTIEIEDLRLLLRPTERYAHGFKYCKGCSQWVRPGDEVYYYLEDDDENNTDNDNPKRRLRIARCPTCKKKLKTKPTNLKSKERLAKLLGSGVKRY